MIDFKNSEAIKVDSLDSQKIKIIKKEIYLEIFRQILSVFNFLTLILTSIILYFEIFLKDAYFVNEQALQPVPTQLLFKLSSFFWLFILLGLMFLVFTLPISKFRKGFIVLLLGISWIFEVLLAFIIVWVMISQFFVIYQAG